MDDSLKQRISNQIFKFETAVSHVGDDDATFTLDFERGVYRQDDLVGLIRDIVPYFALTADELSNFDLSELNRRAFTRISDANPDKKGDYGELLLYIVLSIFYDAPKFVTKARLRSTTVEQIKGFDCAHFTILEDVVTLWLGEAKFHKSFSGALFSAVESLKDHLEDDQRIKRELRLLGGEIEINKQLEPDLYEQVKGYVDGGRSLDSIPIRVPVLLTYDSPYVKLCDGNAASDINSDEFKDTLTVELEAKFQSIYGKDWPNVTNVKLVFFVMPLHSVSDMKVKLEQMEQAMKF